MPAATLPTVDWDTISTMGLGARKSKIDALHLESGFMKCMQESWGKNGAPWGDELVYQHTLNLYNHAQPVAFPTGYEAFDSSTVSPVQSAFYKPEVTGVMMKLGVKEVSDLGGKTDALRKAVEDRQESTLGFLMRQFVKQIVAGGGVGFSRWLTLNGIDYTGTSGGVFEENAVALQGNTIGGLSKSTLSFAKGWNNVLQDLSSAFGANVWRLHLAIMQVREFIGDLSGHRWLMSTNAATFLSRSSTNQIMFVNGADLDLGKTAPTFGGIKIHVEPQMPTAGSATTTYPLSAILLNTKRIRVAFQDKVSGPGGSLTLPHGFAGMGSWANLGGVQYVAGCPIFFRGNTIVEEMGSSAAIIRGEAYA